MSISFEEAISTLTVMFPDWDEETLAALLTSNNYHVERTIETVLTMNGDVNVNPSSTAVSNDRDSYSSNSGSYNQYHEQNEVVRRGSGTSGGPTFPMPAPNAAKNRGAPHYLPDNFLRVS